MPPLSRYDGSFGEPVEPHRGQHLVGPRLRPTPRVAPADAEVLVDVLARGHVEERPPLLRDEGDVGADLPGLFDDVVAEQRPAVPAVGTSSVAAILMNVVFPAPFRPRNPKRRPLATGEVDRLEGPDRASLPVVGLRESRGRRGRPSSPPAARRKGRIGAAIAAHAAAGPNGRHVPSGIGRGRPSVSSQAPCPRSTRADLRQAGSRGAGGRARAGATGPFGKRGARARSPLRRMRRVPARPSVRTAVSEARGRSGGAPHRRPGGARSRAARGPGRVGEPVRGVHHRVGPSGQKRAFPDARGDREQSRDEPRGSSVASSSAARRGRRGPPYRS